MMTYALEKLLDEIEEKGLQKGMEEGLEKGMQKGREEGREEVALRMLKKNMDLESIQEVTELSMDKIRALKERITESKSM